MSFPASFPNGRMGCLGNLWAKALTHDLEGNDTMAPEASTRNRSPERTEVEHSAHDLMLGHVK